MRQSPLELIVFIVAVTLSGVAVAAILVAGSDDAEVRSTTVLPGARASGPSDRDETRRAGTACVLPDDDAPWTESGATSACSVPPPKAVHGGDGTSSTPTESAPQPAKDVAPNEVGEWVQCGLLGTSFLVREDSPAIEVGGDVHVFCCDACFRRWAAGERRSANSLQSNRGYSSRT